MECRRGKFEFPRVRGYKSIMSSVADPRGGTWGVCASPPLFGFFFLQKRSLLAKLVLNEHKICLKMLEMAILETQIFENFWTPLESSRL